MLFDLEDFMCSFFSGNHTVEFRPHSESINGSKYPTGLTQNIWNGYKYIYSKNSDDPNFYPNSSCPPYDRWVGVEGCINQFKPDTKTFLDAAASTYDVYCAEESPYIASNKSYVRVRIHSCASLSCSSDLSDIDGLTGECVNWPLAYGFPIIRLCARIAYNEKYPKLDELGRPVFHMNDDGTSTYSYFYVPDHGYQYHILDKNGFPIFDSGYKVKDQNGNYTGDVVYLPKICVYNDPSMWTLISWFYAIPVIFTESIMFVVSWFLQNWIYLNKFIKNMGQAIEGSGSKIDLAFQTIEAIIDRFDSQSSHQPVHLYESIIDKNKIMRDNGYDRYINGGMPGLSLEDNTFVEIVKVLENLSDLITGDRELNFQVFENQHFNGNISEDFTDYYLPELTNTISTETYTLPPGNNTCSADNAFTALFYAVFAGESECWDYFDVIFGSYPKYIDCHNFYDDRKNFLNENSSIGDYKRWVQRDIICRKESIGCVLANTGPFPPTYCDDLPEILYGIDTEKICAQKIYFDTSLSRYVFDIERSTFLNPCVLSDVHNNFIHNAMRVKISNILPPCSLDENGNINDEIGQCGHLYTSGIGLNAVYHLNKGLLPICNDSRSNNPCIFTKFDNLPTKISRFPMLFRVYTDRTTFREMGTAFPEDIENICDNNIDKSIFPCTQFAGINAEMHEDIAFDLSNNTGNKIQSSNNEYVKKFTMEGMTGTYNCEFHVQEDVKDSNSKNIMYVKYETSTSSPVTTNIINRADAPLFEFLDCTQSNICKDKLTQNKAIGLGKIGYDNITLDRNNTSKILSLVDDVKLLEKISSNVFFSVIKPRALLRNINTTNPDIKNLAKNSQETYSSLLGFIVDSIVVDGSFTYPPYNDPMHSPMKNGQITDTLTRFGKYILPITEDQKDIIYVSLNDLPDTPSYYYVGGLEYVAGLYNKGGEYFCSGNSINLRCPDFNENDSGGQDIRLIKNYSNCVLSKLTYSDVINCCQYLYNSEKCNFSDSKIPPKISDTMKNIRKCSEFERLSALGKFPKKIKTDPQCKITNDIKIPQKDDPTKTLITVATCRTSGKCSLVVDDSLIPIGADICVPSVLPNDRILPKYDENSETFSIAMNQFFNGDQKILDTTNYCYSNDPKEIFDPSKCQMRIKAIHESGNCIAIPESPFKCDPIDEDDIEFGNAYFPAKIPETYKIKMKANKQRIPEPNSKGVIDIKLPVSSSYVEGICSETFRKTGETNNPKSMCIGLNFGVESSLIIPKYSSRITNPCSKISCPAVHDADNASGWAIWDETNVNSTANGHCVEGFYGNPTRKCNSDMKFGEISNPCTEIRYELLVAQSEISFNSCKISDKKQADDILNISKNSVEINLDISKIYGLDAIINDLPNLGHGRIYLPIKIVNPSNKPINPPKIFINNLSFEGQISIRHNKELNNLVTIFTSDFNYDNSYYNYLTTNIEGICKIQIDTLNGKINPTISTINQILTNHPTHSEFIDLSKFLTKKTSDENEYFEISLIIDMIYTSKPNGSIKIQLIDSN